MRSVRVGRAHPRAIPTVVLLAFLLGAAALAVVALWGDAVYASYLKARIIGPRGMLLLGRRIVAEFLACGAIVLLAWRGRWAQRALVLAGVALFALVQYAQFRSAVTSSDLLTPAVLRMIGLYEYAATPAVLLTAAAIVLGAAAVTWAALGLLAIDRLPARPRGAGAALALFAAAVLSVPIPGRREADLRERFGLEARAPVASLVLATTELLRSETPRSPAALGPDDLRLAASYGIELRPDSPTPLRRERVWNRPLPFPGSGGATRPNIIVIFAESLSADLIDPYRASPIGLTPYMSAMAGRSMRVDDYYNHAFPTVRGLRGQLCSVFTSFGHEAWRDSPVKLLDARMRCLPHLLAEEGYRSVYISPGARTEVYTESQFIDFGFDELYFRDTLVAKLLGNEPLERGGMPGDRQTFRALVSYLERWDRSRPLFVAVSTIETHTGWDVTDVGVPWGDGSNRVLNLFHNLDHGFGLFWSWFETSPYRDDTIVVLTGDHVIWPHDTARQAIGDGARPREVDKLALIVYHPHLALPPAFRAPTSSIDFAPSLLHLAGVGNEPNAFAGVSMFADREGLRGGPGQGEWTELLRWEGDRPIVESVTPEGCEPPDSHDTHACSLLRVIDYLHSLESDNRLWRD